MVNPFPEYSTVPTSNLFAWYQASEAYDAADGGGNKITSDGTNIYSLKDLSPTGTRPLNQATAGNRPVYKTSRLNGYPAVYFDGSGDTMATADFDLTEPYSFYVVGQYTVNTKGSFLANGNFSGSGWGSPALWITNDANRLNFYPDSTAGSLGDPINSYWIAQCVANGTSTFAKLDNNTDVSISDPTRYFDGGFLIGNTNGGGAELTGDIVEILAYSEAHTSSTGSGLAVRQYLNSKYALGLSL